MHSLELYYSEEWSRCNYTKVAHKSSGGEKCAKKDALSAEELVILQSVDCR